MSSHAAWSSGGEGGSEGVGMERRINGSYVVVRQWWCETSSSDSLPPGALPEKKHSSRQSRCRRTEDRNLFKRKHV